MLTDMSKFNKPAITVQQQIEKFRNSGLVIDSVEMLQHELEVIGYYRLKGYFQPYVDNQQKITSHQLLEIYSFDRKLRLLFLDSIERIEISLKSIVNNHMSLKYDPFWYINRDTTSQDIIDLITTHYGITDKEHKIVKHFYNKYTSPSFPPSWVMMEVIGMSDISKIISKLSSSDLKPIAQFFDHSPRVLKSWIRSLTITRNICAHHSRLLDRTYKISPERTKEMSESIEKRSLAEQIIIADYLSEKIAPRIGFRNKVDLLIEEYKDIIIKKQMGFKESY